jgi:hypothetical protein
VEENAYITSIVASAFYLIASARFFRLHRRTGERPEWLLALYFALTGLYYLGYNIPNLFELSTWPSRAEVAVEWTFAISVVPYLLFIRSVFRPDAAWASGLVGFCSVALLLSTLMTTVGGRVDYSIDNPWFVAQWLSYTAPYVWLGWEALRYRQSAIKRARVGLCPPLVANRYLLIALFGAFQFLACVVDISLANEIEGSQMISQITDVLLGGTEIASVAVLWLAFFPPSFYANRISQRTVVSATPTAD